MALNSLAKLVEGGGHSGCSNYPQCSSNVRMHDQLAAMVEERHGHPGDSCPETPACTDRVLLAFILERGQYMSVHCLRSVASEVFDDRRSRRQIMVSLKRQLMDQSDEYQRETDRLLAELAKAKFTSIYDRGYVRTVHRMDPKDGLWRNSDGKVMGSGWVDLEGLR